MKANKNNTPNEQLVPPVSGDCPQPDQQQVGGSDHLQKPAAALAVANRRGDTCPSVPHYASPMNTPITKFSDNSPLKLKRNKVTYHKHKHTPPHL